MWHSTACTGGGKQSVCNGCSENGILDRTVLSYTCWHPSDQFSFGYSSLWNCNEQTRLALSASGQKVVPRQNNVPDSMNFPLANISSIGFRITGFKIVFGIPGDYILNFYSMLEKSPINTIGCTREDCAGFAADASLESWGIGAVCVTYCVADFPSQQHCWVRLLKKSPVVLLTGSPGMNERINNPLLHHKVRDFTTQSKLFEKLCIAATELVDPVIEF